MSSSKRSTIIVEHLRRQAMWDSLARGKRLDGRGFTEQRPLEIEVDVIKKANGSARVKLGDSEVIAGVKVETGEPFEGLEDKGALIVTAEVLPTASPHAEPGPPDEEVIELARVVDRGVRESEMIDLGQLALVPGKMGRKMPPEIPQAVALRARNPLLELPTGLEAAPAGGTSVKPTNVLPAPNAAAHPVGLG